MIPFEILSAGGGALFGSAMTIWGEARKDRHQEREWEIKRDQEQEKMTDAARDMEGKWKRVTLLTRALLMLMVFGATIVWPSVASYFMPDATFVYTFMQPEISWLPWVGVHDEMQTLIVGSGRNIVPIHFVFSNIAVSITTMLFGNFIAKRS